MGTLIVLVFLFTSTSVCFSQNDTFEKTTTVDGFTDLTATDTFGNETDGSEGIGTTTMADQPPVSDMEAFRRRMNNQTERLEKRLRSIVKNTIKNFLPNILQHGDSNPLSTKCTRGLMKYIAGLSTGKVWSYKMLDASSKPPSGILEGTVSDFGAFDQCLDIEVPKRKGGDLEFRGQYCAVEARPLMPQQPLNFSLSKQSHAHPLDTIKDELRIASTAFFYLKFRLGFCIPSSCSLEDMQGLAVRISEIARLEVKIPQCYVKEGPTFEPIHVVVIIFVLLLLSASIAGSIIEYNSSNLIQKKPSSSQLQEVLRCFSLISNTKRLLSESKGSQELKALHGLRTLTMAWVLMGHTYVWSNFPLLRRPIVITHWFNRLDFEIVNNGWLSVEPFFFLSGLLTSYAVLTIMQKTKGTLNVPIYILRRYIRLTPPLLLTIGLAFFMPLVSSGPFWYERVDPELVACRNYWWTSVLYVSNWMGLRNICIHPTWYLSADFQLHILSIVFLYLIYKSPKVGVSMIVSFVIACSAVVGVLTITHDLPPTIQTSSGNSVKIQETLDVVHMRTFTHVGPYYVGFVVGFLMIKYKGIQLSRTVSIVGWCASTLLATTSLFGVHRWNVGEPHGWLLTALYASVHRTTFAMAVAWVTFACVTGHGGPVNRLLSCSLLAPLGRLTFSVYLLHSLVIWVRIGSLRDRMFFSHYNVLYELAGNVIFTIACTVPFFLLLEAPLSNLERLIFSRARVAKEETPQKDPEQGTVFSKNITSVPVDVELMAVKNLDLLQNGAVDKKF